MEFKSYVKKYCSRLNLIEKLFSSNLLFLNYDRLKVEKEVDYEILYFNSSEAEPDLFIFGFSFFLSDLSEQEFKKIIGHNSLNFKIYNAYSKLKKKQKKIKITDILNQIQNKRKDSIHVHKILKRILILAYYLNWDLKKDKSDFEGDSIIEIPQKYLTKLKQRFDFTVVTSIYEDNDLFIFLNTKGKLNLVFKELDKFSKDDIERLVPNVFKKIFEIKKIEFK